MLARDKHTSLFPPVDVAKILYNIDTCGLYYKHVTIVNDASSGVNK